MLHQRVYEILPYVYMASGVLAMLVLTNLVAVFSGLLLILAGALVWILRSDHRRGDQMYQNSGRGRVPFWLYELQPFIYASGGLLLWQLGNNSYLYPSALILLVVGIQIWIMRATQRKHRTPSKRGQAH